MRRVRGIAGDNASGRSSTQILKTSHHECPNDRSTPNRQLSSQCPRAPFRVDRTNAIYNASEERRKEREKEKEKKRKREKKNKGGSVRARAWTVGWDRSSGINGKLPALRFPISLQLRGDELAERRHASRRRLTAKRRVLLERALSVSITQLVRGKVCPAN